MTQVPPARPFLGARPATDAVPPVIGVPVLFLAIFGLAVWGRRHGAVLGSPVLLATVVVLFAASGSEWYQRLLGGGHLHNRVVLRLVHATVLIGLVLLAAGWSFLVPAAVVLIGVLHIGWSGSQTWKPATAVTAAATIAMEVAVQFGAPSVVAPAHSHLAAVINLLLAGFGLSNLGLAAARAEEATLTLQRAEERFRALVQDSSDVVAVIGADGRMTHVSDAVCHVSGWDPADLRDTAYLGLFHPDDQAELGTALTEVTGGGADTQARLELRVAHRDGTWHWHEVTLRNALDHPAVGGIVSNQRDISDRRAQQDRLAHAAAHDPLTGLPNRAEVLRVLEAALAGADGAESVALFFIDLDGFKAVNDGYGHAAGDALLVAAAQRLRAGLRAEDLLGRLGGDEFAAVLTGITDPADVRDRAGRLMADMDLPFDLPGHRVRIGASIGVAFGGTGTDADDLVAAADTRMYEVKGRVFQAATRLSR
ncbi:diguanylate cyclase domain-containing protein [Actinoplanes sp. CA-252034]|uniref:diguanylate cyclase domain-containing protein n=1 Tax=Actinoplanes sp. CA-252034 TaxID=3239906 RepID=UPI003D986776